MDRKTVVMVCCCTVFFGIWQSDECRAGEYRLYPSQDSWVNEANPNAAYGSNSYLSVKDRSGAAEALLGFAATDFAAMAGERVIGASLWLYQYQGTYTPGDTVYLHAITEGWDEETVTWNSRPQTEAVALSSLVLTEGNECWRSFAGLEERVSALISGGTLSLCLENDRDAVAGELFCRFYSSEAPVERRPYLLVSTESLPLNTAPEPVSAALFAGGGALLSLAGKRCKKN